MQNALESNALITVALMTRNHCMTGESYLTHLTRNGLGLHAAAAPAALSYDSDTLDILSTFLMHCRARSRLPYHTYVPIVC